jgi:hypothetical protein
LTPQGVAATVVCEDWGVSVPHHPKQFDHAIAHATNAASVWKALEELSRATPGHRLFTVMTVDMQAGLARRAYSSNTSAYPVSGTKPIQRNAWFEFVHGRQQSFVANTLTGIAEVFPDHELIGSLGLASVFNLPVVLLGELAATINMLHEAGHYTPVRVAEGEALLAVPAKLCVLLAMRFDRLSEMPQ